MSLETALPDYLAYLVHLAVSTQYAPSPVQAVHHTEELTQTELDIK